MASVPSGYSFSRLRCHRNDAVDFSFSAPGFLKLKQNLSTKSSSFCRWKDKSLGTGVIRAQFEAVIEKEEKVKEKGRVLRVGLVCGGPSAESGISLNSARSVLDHIQVYTNTSMKECTECILDTGYLVGTSYL